MDSYTKPVEDWFAMIRGGQITLPRFQRDEAWKKNQIAGVFESILRQPSLPIGALLLLQVGNEELFLSRPISGAPPPKNTPQMNLLDGQQRMTALWRALNDDYEDFAVFVSLEDEKCPDIKIESRYKSQSGKRMPAWTDDPGQTFKRRLFPVSLLCPGNDGENKMSTWTDRAGTDKRTDMLIMKLRERLAKYPIPCIVLPVDTDPETALDVFINMNTSASPLKDFDIVVAQLESATGDSLHDMIEELHAQVPTLPDYGRAEDTALAVGALLNGKPPLKKTYLNREFGQELANVWDQVVSGLSKGVSFLHGESIFNEKLLPSEIILYLTSALWANVPTDGGDEEGRARAQIRKAIWRAGFTNRYIQTVTTKAFADYKALADLIKNPNSTSLPDLFDEEQNPLPTANELRGAAWPGRKDRLGRAIIAVSLYGGGYDFAEDAEANADNVGSREYHHIFPKSLIKGQFDDRMVNSALNCALISWKTNRRIAAKTPAQYIQDRTAGANATEEDVRRRLESHLIPYDELINGDFDAFIAARAEKVRAKMETLCHGQIP